jgi:hypothetical protein
MQQSDVRPLSQRAMLLYGALMLVTLAMPLVLWRLPFPFIRLMDAVYHPLPLLQLFVFCAALALTGVGAYAFYQVRGQALQKQFPLLLSLLVFFHFLALLRQHAARSWDYACYERAAQAIVQGLSPYGDCYLYFPTPAQTLAWLYQLGAYGASFVMAASPAKTEQLWDLVFYFYEATQFFQVILAYALCYRFARRLGLAAGRASLLVALLFLFNNPLLATLKHNQVNLWVLNLLLAALLWLPRSPILSGLCVAVGGHIKLYPLILLLPWTLMRQWRALVAAGIGMAALVLIQTKGGQDWQLWQAFLTFAGAFPKGTFFRDNSLHSLVYNAIGQLKWLLGDSSYTVNEQTVGRVVLVLTTFFGLLYLVRFFQREQHATRSKPLQAATPTAQVELTQLGHMMDAIALGLLISPVVWEHHYLLALPLVIWGLAGQQTVERLWLVALSAFLIFVIPTFDIFPLSYHRLAGLLLLISTFPPVMVAPWAVLRDSPLTFEPNSQAGVYPQVNEF